MNAETIARFAAQDRFRYFQRGALPCLFFLQVEEGFVRLDVQDPATLEKLMAYCKQKAFDVDWSSAELEDDDAGDGLDDMASYPGGKYIAYVDASAREHAGAPV